MVLALVVLTASFGFPVQSFAQTAPVVKHGTISGEAMDAGGRGIAQQRVELVQGSQVLQVTMTGNRGEFTFAKVTPGDYVVRTMVNGHVTGIRVTVASASVANATIVAPSAAAPSGAFLAGLGPLLGTLVVGGIVAAVVTTVVVVSGS